MQNSIVDDLRLRKSAEKIELPSGNNASGSEESMNKLELIFRLAGTNLLLCSFFADSLAAEKINHRHHITSLIRAVDERWSKSRASRLAVDQNH